MASKNRKVGQYDPGKLVDAPEYHSLSRAMGILTWSTWDRDPRPVEDRISEFLATFPPNDPTRHLAVALMKGADGAYGPASPEDVVARLRGQDGHTGSLDELLARYGLRIRGAKPIAEHSIDPGAFLVVARRRNHKLRVLHGGVDVEPENMDAAKAEYLDRQEKQHAALEVRAARRRMAEELAGKAPGKRGR